LHDDGKDAKTDLELSFGTKDGDNYAVVELGHKLMGTRFLWAALIAAITITVASAGMAQELPRYDIAKDCAVNSLGAANCIAQEHKNLGLLTALWSRASSTAKLKCLPQAGQDVKNGLPRNYTSITECLVPVMRIEESKLAVERRERDDIRNAQRPGLKRISSAAR